MKIFSLLLFFVLSLNCQSQFGNLFGKSEKPESPKSTNTNDFDKLEYIIEANLEEKKAEEDKTNAEKPTPKTNVTSSTTNNPLTADQVEPQASETEIKTDEPVKEDLKKETLNSNLKLEDETMAFLIEALGNDRAIAFINIISGEKNHSTQVKIYKKVESFALDIDSVGLEEFAKQLASEKANQNLETGSEEKTDYTILKAAKDISPFIQVSEGLEQPITVGEDFYSLIIDYRALNELNTDTLKEVLFQIPNVNKADILQAPNTLKDVPLEVREFLADNLDQENNLRFKEIFNSGTITDDEVNELLLLSIDYNSQELEDFVNLIVDEQVDPSSINANIKSGKKITADTIKLSYKNSKDGIFNKVFKTWDETGEAIKLGGLTTIIVTTFLYKKVRKTTKLKKLAKKEGPVAIAAKKALEAKDNAKNTGKAVKSADDTEAAKTLATQAKDEAAKASKEVEKAIENHVGGKINKGIEAIENSGIPGGALIGGKMRKAYNNHKIESVALALAWAPSKHTKNAYLRHKEIKPKLRLQVQKDLKYNLRLKEIKNKFGTDFWEAFALEISLLEKPLNKIVLEQCESFYDIMSNAILNTGLDRDKIKLLGVDKVSELLNKKFRRFPTLWSLSIDECKKEVKQILTKAL